MLHTFSAFNQSNSDRKQLEARLSRNAKDGTAGALKPTGPPMVPGSAPARNSGNHGYFREEIEQDAEQEMALARENAQDDNNEHSQVFPDLSDHSITETDASPAHHGPSDAPRAASHPENDFDDSTFLKAVPTRAAASMPPPSQHRHDFPSALNKRKRISQKSSRLDVYKRSDSLEDAYPENTSDTSPTDEQSSSKPTQSKELNQKSPLASSATKQEQKDSSAKNEQKKEPENKKEPATAHKPPPNPHLQLIRNTLTDAWRKFDKKLSVDPDSSRKRVWNMFALLVVTFNCIIIPLRIGWGQHQLWWIPIDLLTDLVTLIDMFLFSISMYVKDGAKVHEFRFTMRHYMFSWYFFFDFLSVIPVDIVGWFAGGYSFYRLNRMIRITREKYYFETIEELFPNIRPTIIRLLRSIVFTLNCAHCIACCFFLLMSSQGEDVLSVDFIPGKVYLLRMSFFSQYIRCFYWALVTMTGYSNTQPQTNLETAFSLVVSAMGLSLYITIIGTVGSLMSNLDASKQYFISRMDQINAFMNFRQLPNEMQEQIREYYTYLWKSRRSLNESNVFIDLPMHLQIEVAMKLNEKFIKKVDIFQGAEKQFIERIVVKMKPKLALPNVFIVRQGEIGREMYLISKGEVEVVLGNGLIVATLPEGKIFGEIALLENCRRNASIRAKTHCDLFILSKKDFTEALEAFPQQKERVAELARRKKEETAAKNKK